MGYQGKGGEKSYLSSKDFPTSGVKAMMWESVQCLLPEAEEGSMTGIREQRYCVRALPCRNMGRVWCFVITGLASACHRSIGVSVTY